jgi:hypothetical protein
MKSLGEQEIHVTGHYRTCPAFCPASPFPLDLPIPDLSRFPPLQPHGAFFEGFAFPAFLAVAQLQPLHTAHPWDPA